MSEQKHHGSMGSRGVTRPMAEMEMQHGHEDHGDQHGHDSGGGHEHGGGHEMSREDRLSMLEMHFSSRAGEI